MDDIAELKREIAELRENAQRADASIAFLLGMLLEETFAESSLDLAAKLAPAGQAGWDAALIERVVAGQSEARAARRDRHRRARREQK